MSTLTASSSFSSSSSSSSSSSLKYDVFLSFCSVDTCKNFTDHLYIALRQKGIITFRNDDEILEQGKYISSGLLKVIEESKYAIIFLSTNYASSRWCLIELAKIVKCIEETKLTVLPIFYHVDVSDLRNQTGTLAEAFEKHEKDPKANKEDVQAWKAALKEVGKISGWDLHDRHESIIIQEILERISSELNLIFQSTISKELVGIESPVMEMLDLYLVEGLGGVRFVGICGMGGMGKTTLALEIYERISGSFEASSFIANVREKTKNHLLVSLQEQLLSNILKGSRKNISNVFEGINVIGNRLRDKKVLIVLDDVDGDEQLEALVGNHDWFGSGSRIIVTSRDKHLLKRCGMNDIYTVKGLNDNDALQLFSWRAFKKPYPEENYVELSKDLVNYANGLPLALKVLGSLLFGKRIDEWKSALYKLKQEPDRNILNILQISFDGLMYTQKELFLDIACFFKGKNKDDIRDILQSFGYYPNYNIDVLIDKSLITIDRERSLLMHESLWMHDLLQEMGQEIVRRESPEEPGCRSRLWLYEDVLHILRNNTGTEVVEGIVLNMPIEAKEHLSAKAFSKMKNLRFLKIGYVHPPQDLIGGPIQLPQGLNYLSNELRVIDWHGYPLKSMPTNFQPNKLVELRMHCSDIKQLWKGIIILNELKLIDLSDSRNLIEIPDLSGAPNLKQLILRRCTRLYKIHASIGDLKRLIRLDLNGCKRLESLPHKISLEALEYFDLGGCSKLKKFPEIVENMSCLSKLCLSETAIKDPSLLVERSTGLIDLDLRDCKNLSSLPIAICSLTSLKTLNISDCTKLDKLPENLGNIEGLEELDGSRTAIKELPSSMVLLKNLQNLSLRGCNFLSSKPSNKLLNFPLLQRRSLDSMGMSMLALSGLSSLTYMNLSYCNLQAVPDVIGCLSSLKSLNLKGNNFVSLPEDIVRLSKLEDLYLSGCTNLRSLPQLPLSVDYLGAEGCTSLETLPLRPEEDFHPHLYLLNCFKLNDNQDYSGMFLTMLRHYIQRPDLGLQNILIPGSRIPKWFSHQSEGVSLNLQEPPGFIGIALCVVFVLCEHHPLQHPESSENHPSTHFISFLCNVNGYKVPDFLSFGFSEQSCQIDSNHLWIKYFSMEGLWGQILSQVYANDQLSQVDVGIEIEVEGTGLEVRRCGVRLVYEQDIEDLKQNMAGSCSCSVTPYEDDLDDSAKDTIMKRSHDDHDGDGDGPSGEVTYNEVDVPHPKRIRLPDLIERFIPRLGNWIGNSSTKEQGDSDCEEEKSQ